MVRIEFYAHAASLKQQLTQRREKQAQTEKKLEMKKASLRIAANVMTSGRAYGYSVHNSGLTSGTPEAQKL
jgi:hypothetical protein